MLNILSIGAFGKVFLVKETLTSDPNSDEDSTEDEKSSGGSLKNSPVIKRKAQSDMNIASKVSPLKKDTKKVEFYAVKILSKHQIMKAKQVDHVFNEMTLQQQLRHPFIVTYLCLKLNFRLTWREFSKTKGHFI